MNSQWVVSESHVDQSPVNPILEFTEDWSTRDSDTTINYSYIWLLSNKLDKCYMNVIEEDL